MSSVRFQRLERRGARRVGGRLELEMSLPKTPSGMETRWCPREDCAPRLFQLGAITSDAEWNGAETRVHRAPHTSGTTCPYCGHDSADDEAFIDPRDVEALTAWFKWAAQEDAFDAVSDMLRSVGRRLPRSGAVSIQVKANRGPVRPESRVWREDLLRQLTCSVCSRRYGVYAIALFCPDCGAPNLAVHYRRECDLIEQQITLAREASEPEFSFRLLGNAHEDVVTALETYLKTAYRFLVGKQCEIEEATKLRSSRAIGNAFQNIDRAREKLARVGIDPFARLSEDDRDYLQINIEKRHVLGHNLGLADERYAELVQAAQPGRTIVLLADEVVRFVEIARRLVQHLEAQVFPGIEAAD